MNSQHVLNHASNVYVTVTISSSSPLSRDPEELARRSSLTYVGNVGQLQDVHVLSVPKSSWDNTQHDVLRRLNSMEGVTRVEVQEPPRTRAKRGIDEL